MTVVTFENKGSVEREITGLPQVSAGTNSFVHLKLYSLEVKGQGHLGCGLRLLEAQLELTQVSWCRGSD